MSTASRSSMATGGAPVHGSICESSLLSSNEHALIASAAKTPTVRIMSSPGDPNRVEGGPPSVPKPGLTNRKVGGGHRIAAAALLLRTFIGT